MKSRWLDSVGLENREEFLRRVAVSGKVRLVVFGHVHQPYDAEHDGIHVVGTPSTCRQFKQRSTLFAVDDNPPAYRRIRLHDDGRFDLIVSGHVHIRDDWQFESGDASFRSVNLGSWLDKPCFFKLDDNGEHFHELATKQ